ncbi:MAG: transposase [Candidatus Uhrbacteria bacterium]|nr:transposase [Candidatus Uhrbacteria bacterium]
MQRVPLTTGEYYHITNRGVNRSEIFHNAFDFLRFYQSLFLFNDAKFSVTGDPVDKFVRLAVPEMYDFDQDPFVSVLAFIIMPNHFHLYVRQEMDNGIERFLHKISLGYAKYHNLKYKRTGPLYEGRYKAFHVDNEAHYIHVPRYIHLNGLDGTGIQWRDGLVTDWEDALRQLDNYRWSSHHVYMGRKQEIAVVDEDFVLELFSSPEEYVEFLKSWTGRYVLDL